MDTRSLPVPGPDPHPVHGASRAFREGLPPAAGRQYDLLAARLAHALDAGTGCDERLMRLPHPGRIAAHGALHAQAELFRAFAPTAWAAARNPGCLRSAIAGLLATQHPGFAHAFCRSDREAMMDAALWLMVAAGRIHCLQTTDALEERLRRTDFGRDVPGAFFRLPFPAVFLEFGARRDFPVTLMHAESGGHVVEGVYLLEGQMLPSLTAPAREPVRGFDVIVFGSAMGKSGVLDDVFIHMALPVMDERAPIVETLERAIEAHLKRQEEVFNAPAFAPVVEHAAKILMYLGTREARQRECREKSDALAALGRLRSPAKAQKVSRQAERLMDRIVVGPAAFEARQDVPAGHHASPGTHWRRGHFRMQAYGPHHAERRPTWIAPVLVNGDLLGGAPAKAYSVR